MKSLPSTAAILTCALALVLTAACSRNEGPPPALSLQELPPALQTAFAKAKPETRPPLDLILAALQTNGYPQALEGLQTLSALPGLTRKQANVAAAGLVTVNNALQEAQSHGDEQAAETLQLYRRSK